MPATELVHQTGFVLRYVLLISVMSALIADVLAGRVAERLRRALLDRLPAEAKE
jgi:DMSO/TMAO reductase YedYZ heme-binding membrane subunit